ncbi:hypothetical protein [Pelagibius sp. Alg239-R121]|uniref:hypothetical protein n=1 Tax=Pelagibius sp. Alg239-R121 TaxID=2993448 RepID=UPI0024A7437C|nr:hypothetical protein [Pelagibius sp. Alg239-R121]
MQDSSQQEPPDWQPSPEPPAPTDPKDAVFTNIMWIMIANVLVGAVLAITGATLDLSPAFGRVGLGLAIICGSIYFFFRWLQRKEARRREKLWEEAHQTRDTQSGDET